MVFDSIVDMDVPVFYVLVDRRDEDTYWNVLNFLVIQSGRKFETENVTCDFERALLNAIVEQFPRANIVGYLFH